MRFKDRWNPYQRFTINESELREWFNQYGATAFYDGRLWRPRHRRVFGGRNAIVEVWFTEETFNEAAP